MLRRILLTPENPGERVQGYAQVSKVTFGPQRSIFVDAGHPIEEQRRLASARHPMFAIALVGHIGDLLELSWNLPDVILVCFEAPVSAFFERQWSIGESRIQSTFMGMERGSKRLAQSSSEQWSTRILVGFFERIMDRLWREADFRSETAYARDTSG